MSISSLVSQFGITLNYYAPLNTIQTDGTVIRTYGKTYSAVGFVQPSGESEPFINGRQEGIRTATIYFPGKVTYEIEGEFRDSDSLPARRWRITGAYNPAELDVTGRNAYLNMSVVSVVEVVPLDTEIEL